MKAYERKELKYYVPLEYFGDLRNRLLTYMRHDPFCNPRNDYRYQVRSIYYDTRSCLFYFEKISGLKVRKKLRIRTYERSESNGVVFLEIKRKIEDMVRKERAAVPLQNLAEVLKETEFFSGVYYTGNDERVLNKFTYLLKKLQLEPRVMIVYEREAFLAIDDPAVRATLDLDVRSVLDPSLKHLAGDHQFRSMNARRFILELKLTSRMPAWMRRLLREFNLRDEAISKYCHGLDLWPAVVNPHKPSV